MKIIVINKGSRPVTDYEFAHADLILFQSETEPHFVALKNRIGERGAIIYPEELASLIKANLAHENNNDIAK